MNEKTKPIRNAEYYEKRAREEWRKMFEYAEEAEKTACEDECVHNTQKSKQAARRAVMYEVMAKNVTPGFKTRRAKLQVIQHPSPPLHLLTDEEESCYSQFRDD
jgi:hypothetical protein